MCQGANEREGERRRYVAKDGRTDLQRGGLAFYIHGPEEGKGMDRIGMYCIVEYSAVLCGRYLCT